VTRERSCSGLFRRLVRSFLVTVTDPNASIESE